MRSPASSARILATVRSGFIRSAQVIRMHRHPVSSRILSSRRFSRSTAAVVVSPSRRCLVYFSLPSNSSHTPYSGQAKSSLATSWPFSSRTTNWGSGAGNP